MKTAKTVINDSISHFDTSEMKNKKSYNLFFLSSESKVMENYLMVPLPFEALNIRCFPGECLIYPRYEIRESDSILLQEPPIFASFWPHRW